jgi:hypothetical protein
MYITVSDLYKHHECCEITKTIGEKRKKINVLVKECFRTVLPEPVEGMRDRWTG